MFESVTQESEQRENNLGYVLGWCCGGLPIVGVIVSAVNFFQGDRRKAFQAIVLPAAVLAWVSGVVVLAAVTGADSAGWAWQSAMYLLLFGGTAVIPIFGLRFLRDLAWPAPGCWSR